MSQKFMILFRLFLSSHAYFLLNLSLLVNVDSAPHLNKDQISPNVQPLKLSLEFYSYLYQEASAFIKLIKFITLLRNIILNLNIINSILLKERNIKKFLRCKKMMNKKKNTLTTKEVIETKRKIRLNISLEKQLTNAELHIRTKIHVTLIVLAHGAVVSLLEVHAIILKILPVFLHLFSLVILRMKKLLQLKKKRTNYQLSKESSCKNQTRLLMNVKLSIVPKVLVILIVLVHGARAQL